MHWFYREGQHLDWMHFWSDGCTIKRGKGISNPHWIGYPYCPGAIIFDLYAAQQESWEENPYRSLGRRAYEALSEILKLEMLVEEQMLTGSLKGG